MACDNSSATALFLRYGNVTISSDPPVESRGFALGVGTPPQPLAVRPRTRQNDTWIPNPAICNQDSTDLECLYQEGGSYFRENSSTYQFSSFSTFNGSGYNEGSYDYFNDNLQLNDTTIYSYPMILQSVVNGINGGGGYIGLASASPWLSALVELGAVPSRTWSMWYGSDSVDDPVDGSLIFGGYDENKAVGSAQFSMRDSCPLCARLAQLEYIVGDRRFPLIGTSFTVDFEPSEPGLSLHYAAFEAFLNATNATFYPNYNAYGVERSEFVPGELSAAFSNGYRTTIPAHELWRPEIDMTIEGRPTVNESSPMFMNVYNDTSPSSSAPWGGSFLAMNYLIAHPDDGIFELAPITPEMRRSPISMRSICSQSTMTNETSTEAASTSPSSNTGAIAGGVVGGIVGLVVILLVAFFILRKRRRQTEELELVTNATASNTEAKQQQAYEGHMISEKLNDREDHGVMATPPPPWHPRFEMPADFIGAELPSTR